MGEETLVTDRRDIAAIRVINHVLIGIRELAYAKASHDDVARALDIAECLPSVLLSHGPSDLFRGSLGDLVKVSEDFRFAIERFDQALADRANRN
jgi:hypothetical protein